MQIDAKRPLLSCADAWTAISVNERNADKSSRWRVGRNGQAGNILEFLQQSFATRPTPATVLRSAYFPFIFATDIYNAPSPMFPGPSAMMQDLPFSRHQGFSSEPPLTYSPKRRVQSADCRRYFRMPRLCSPLCGLLRERRASGPNSRRTKTKMNTSSCLPSGPIKGINLHCHYMPPRGRQFWVAGMAQWTPLCDRSPRRFDRRGHVVERSSVCM